MLKKQRPYKLPRAFNLVDRHCGDVCDIHGEKEYRYNPQGDEPCISDCAYGAGTFHFSEQVERIRPANICEICLDESRGEGIGIGGTPVPDTVKVRKRVGNASETPQDAETCGRNTTEDH